MHALNAMHEKMHRMVQRAGGRIDAIFFCPHTPDAGCQCRKPKPGMVIDIAERYGVKPDSLIMIGDSLRDLESVAAVGGRIDAVFYCPHAPDEACHCRTPAPGLLEQICDRYGVEPFDARVVGSCAEHLQAGAALGAQVHLVCTGSAAHLGRVNLNMGASSKKEIEA